VIEGGDEFLREVIKVNRESVKIFYNIIREKT
jgi:hypothetical protein